MGAGVAAPRGKNTPSRVARSDHLLLAFVLLCGSVGDMAIVAVINSSADTVEMLRVALQQAGFEAVTAHIDEIKHGVLDFSGFLAQHDPRAVIYDIPPPYDQNWRFFQLLSTTEAMCHRTVVLTTTHKGHLEEMVGPTDAIEIVGKPYDVNKIIDAVRRGVGQG